MTPCLCPSFAPHQSGCPERVADEAAADRLLAERAAARVRASLAQAREPAPVTVLRPDGGPVAPNQVLHYLQQQMGDVTEVVLAWRDPEGAWTVDWSDAPPGALLEAALAIRLEAEAAWCETQDQIGPDVGDELEEDPDE